MAVKLEREYVFSKEHRGRIREATKATQFKKGKISWNKGIKSGNHGNGFKEGMTPWNKGKPRSKETKEKIRTATRGERNWNWKGGRSQLTDRIRTCSRYLEWRAEVFRRDGWTCQTCGLRGHGNDIEAHHINPMKNILKKVQIEGLSINDRYFLAVTLNELFDLANGITLCKDCHIITYKRRKK